MWRKDHTVLRKELVAITANVWVATGHHAAPPTMTRSTAPTRGLVLSTSTWFDGAKRSILHKAGQKRSNFGEWAFSPKPTHFRVMNSFNESLRLVLVKLSIRRLESVLKCQVDLGDFRLEVIPWPSRHHEFPTSNLHYHFRSRSYACWSSSFLSPVVVQQAQKKVLHGL
jgi:hypothetical protein